MAARNQATSVYGSYGAGILYLFFGIMSPLIGIMVYKLSPGLEDTSYLLVSAAMTHLPAHPDGHLHCCSYFCINEHIRQLLTGWRISGYRKPDPCHHWKETGRQKSTVVDPQNGYMSMLWSRYLLRFGLRRSMNSPFWHGHCYWWGYLSHLHSACIGRKPTPGEQYLHLLAASLSGLRQLLSSSIQVSVGNQLPLVCESLLIWVSYSDGWWCALLGCGLYRLICSILCFNVVDDRCIPGNPESQSSRKSLVDYYGEPLDPSLKTEFRLLADQGCFPQDHKGREREYLVMPCGPLSQQVC